MRSLLRPALPALALLILAAPQRAMAHAGEPAEASWDPRAAAAYLDERAAYWLDWDSAARGQGTACLSCHTTVPLALARPALGKRLNEPAAGAAESRLVAGVRKRVDGWDNIVSDSAGGDNPFRPFYGGSRKATALGTESVLNALVLVNEDARRGDGTLGKQTGKALDHLWERQQADGAWAWLDFGLRPWEKEGDYYGAALAALAAGTAGEKYARHNEIRDKVAALKTYLQRGLPAQPLHNRLFGLWASSRLEGVLTAEDRKRLVREVLELQEADGGWSLPKLGKQASGGGEWERHGTYPARAVSDGYATGLAVLALRGAGVPGDDPQLRKAVDWLRTHQKEGTWPAVYPNRERDPGSNVGKFMRDAATGFSVLALTECGQ